MKNNTILIIEDDLEFAQKMACCLQSGGFDTLHTNSVNQALKIIEENQPRGIVLDIQLKDSLGLNILKSLTSENRFAGFSPVIIVVSSFVGPQTVPILQKYQIPYYDKTLTTYKHSLVLKSFSIYLDSHITQKSLTTPTKNETPVSFSTALPIGGYLKKIIYQKLEFYELNETSTAYKRLVDGIYYTLNPDKCQKDSLTSIYVDVLNIDYHTAFSGIKRLIADTFKNNPSVFTDFTQNKTKKEPPTPKEFIYHIVSEIRKEYL